MMMGRRFIESAFTHYFYAENINFAFVIITLKIISYTRIIV